LKYKNEKKLTYKKKISNANNTVRSKRRCLRVVGKAFQLNGYSPCIMSNGLQMVKKKIKRLSAQNETNTRTQGSIEKYCTTKKINKKKNLCDRIKKSGHLRKRKKQNTTPNILYSEYNERKSFSSNDQIEKRIYDSRQISPTKLSISVKKFYSNNNLMPCEENEHTLICNKNKSEGYKYTTNDVEHSNISKTKKKSCHRTKRKHQSVNYHKPYDFIPQ